MTKASENFSLVERLKATEDLNFCEENIYENY